ncbi:MAG TPA: glycosyl hydrolase family 79 C-terminal domain-containing protein [Solirubrobacteraceae bacterium]|nr:glycosyl hydrolase family 79 C-terminal domain-containing protein [Solirubrobacteraceae bacterium]
MALLVALAGGLARAATDHDTTQAAPGGTTGPTGTTQATPSGGTQAIPPGATQTAPRPGTRAFATRLALLRKVASPGGGWAPLRAGAPEALETPAAVGVWTKTPGRRVPGDFLGLSFESTTLSSLPALVQGGTLEHLLSSLGRGTLRFGGGSVNRYVAWEQPGTPAPAWATHPVTPADLQSLAPVTRRTGWKVLLTMNLAHYEPRSVAEEAASARRQLGSGLAGIAVGNEPDRFTRYGLRRSGWGFSQYARQLAAYRDAIAASAPETSLAAPDVSTGEPPLPWVWESIGLHPAILTDHYYPLTACEHQPTVSQLLSPEVRLQETVMLRTLGDIQRTAGAPLVLDETNDISCKGEPGVSNTFASALWAADYVARAMRAGLHGVDFHTLLNLPESYTALVGEGRSLRPNPEWYGLLLTHALQGTRVLPTSVSSRSDLSAQAFLRPDGAIELLLVNFYPRGSRPVRTALTVHGRSANGTILRLTAPSTLATTGVKLGGEEVSASGRWHPQLPLPALRDRGGSLSLSMPARSAALVTIPPGR